MGKVSIIVTHWAMNTERSETMRVSMQTLFQTAPEAEIFVVDNGGSDEDSKWLLMMNMQGHIATYIRNRKNMHFGFARNQGMKLASGDYIVIADNDIEYKEGWMEECVEFLDEHPGKYMATPIAADIMNAVRKVRWAGEVDGWRLNYRAGSNVFMMRRSDFEVLGFFEQHRIAGSHYFDNSTNKGYMIALMPEPKAFDMGFRKGYNLKEHIPHTGL